MLHIFERKNVGKIDLYVQKYTVLLGSVNVFFSIRPLNAKPKHKHCLRLYFVQTETSIGESYVINPDKLYHFAKHSLESAASHCYSKTPAVAVKFSTCVVIWRVFCR